MSTRRMLLALLLGTVIASPVLAADRDPHGLAQAIAKALAAKRQSSPALVPRIHATDFQGTDIGCIVMPRRELRPFGYPGHAFFCEVAGTGEVLGSILNRTGKRLCDIRGSYDTATDDLCYSLDFCGFSERVCVVS